MNDVKAPTNNEFNKLIRTLRFNNPETIDGAVDVGNGLAIHMNGGEWARAALVATWIEKDKGSGGRKRDKNEMAQNSTIYSIRDFAKLGIKGLSTQDTVRQH